MDVLGLTVPLNTPAMPAAGNGELVALATDTQDAELDFAAVLAAGMLPPAPEQLAQDVGNPSSSAAQATTKADEAAAAAALPDAALPALGAQQLPMQAALQTSAAEPRKDPPFTERIEDASGSRAPRAVPGPAATVSAAAHPIGAAAATHIAAGTATIAAGAASDHGIDAAGAANGHGLDTARAASSDPLLAIDPQALATQDTAGTAASTTEAPGATAQPAASAAAVPAGHLASVSHTSLAQPTAVLEVATPVTSGQFSEALSQRVVWMADKDAQVAQLYLNPPELGPVEVRLTLSGDEASAQFVSPHAEVRNAIEASLARLREALAEAGIALGQASVSAESFRDDQTAEQSASRQPGTGYGETPRTAERGVQGLSAATAHRGLVDVFA